jgi:hypothetical protein
VADADKDKLKDIERYASRLIDQDKSEKESHERPLSEARNRVENCY